MQAYVSESINLRLILRTFQGKTYKNDESDNLYIDQCGSFGGVGDRTP